MKIEDTFPLEELKKRLPNSDLKIETSTAIARIAAVDPENTIGMSLSIWNRIVMAGAPPVNRMALAKQIQAREPKLYRDIQKIIGKDVVYEAFWIRVKDEQNRTVASFFVARVYPNELHLIDVYFQNPTKPLPSDQEKASTKFKGFGLLPLVVENLKCFAKSKGCEFITMQAAFADLMPRFEQCGFKVENNEMARNAVNVGAGIPMELRI